MNTIKNLKLKIKLLKPLMSFFLVVAMLFACKNDSETKDDDGKKNPPVDPNNQKPNNQKPGDENTNNRKPGDEKEKPENTETNDETKLLIELEKAGLKTTKDVTTELKNGSLILKGGAVLAMTFKVYSVKTYTYKKAGKHKDNTGKIVPHKKDEEDKDKTETVLIKATDLQKTTDYKFTHTESSADYLSDSVITYEDSENKVIWTATMAASTAGDSKNKNEESKLSLKIEVEQEQTDPKLASAPCEFKFHKINDDDGAKD